VNLRKQSGVLIGLLFSFLFLNGPIVNGYGQEDGRTSKPSGNTVTAKEDTKGDPAKGKEVFEAACALCHNADSNEAKAGGPGLKNLFHWPPHKLSDGTEHKEHTVENIRQRILEGNGKKRPVGAFLSEEALSNLLAYLQTL
jgi:mono/diheme cytochrome c family protein